MWYLPTRPHALRQNTALADLHQQINSCFTVTGSFVNRLANGLRNTSRHFHESNPYEQRCCLLTQLPQPTPSPSKPPQDAILLICNWIRHLVVINIWSIFQVIPVWICLRFDTTMNLKVTVCTYIHHKNNMHTYTHQIHHSNCLAPLPKT